MFFCIFCNHGFHFNLQVNREPGHQLTVNGKMDKFTLEYFKACAKTASKRKELVEKLLSGSTGTGYNHCQAAYLSCILICTIEQIPSRSVTPNMILSPRGRPCFIPLYTDPIFPANEGDFNPQLLSSVIHAHVTFF